MKALMIYLLFTVSLASAQTNFEIASTDSSINLLNEHGVFITNLNPEILKISEVETAIKQSDHKDSQLIVSVLKMQGDPKSKMQELMNLRRTYTFITEIMDEHIYGNLKSKYGKRKTKKMMKRKN